MSEDPILNSMIRRWLPVYTVCAYTLLALSTLTFLSYARNIIVLLFFSVLTSFILYPGVRILCAYYVPKVISVIMVIVLCFGSIFFAAKYLADGLGKVFVDIPLYQKNLTLKLHQLSILHVHGKKLEDWINTASKFNNSFGRDHNVQPSRHMKHVETVYVVESSRKSSVATFITMLKPIVHPMTTFGLVILFTFFILYKREDLRNRVIRLIGSYDTNLTISVIDEMTNILRKLLLTQMSVNLGYGLLVAILLCFIHFPNATLFGTIAGITKFIPYLGAIVGTGLPVLMACASEPTWILAVKTLAIFIVIQPIISHFIEPFIYGHSIGISPIAVLLIALILTSLWGAVGLVLAMPTAVFLVVLGRYINKFWYLDIILSNRPALSGVEIFYQRILAVDLQGAFDQAKNYIKQYSLIAYFDHIVIKGIFHGYIDHARGYLSDYDKMEFKETLQQLIKLCVAYTNLAPQKGYLKNILNYFTLRESRVSTSEVVVSENQESSRAKILCIYGTTIFDELNAELLKAILDMHALPCDFAQDLNQVPGKDKHYDIACFINIEPISLSRIRLCIRLTRKRFPKIKTIVAVWNLGTVKSYTHIERALSANACVPSYQDLYNHIRTYLHLSQKH